MSTSTPLPTLSTKTSQESPKGLLLGDTKPCSRGKLYIDESSDNDNDPTHWMLKGSIDPSKHSGLYRLQHKLKPDNYVSWMSTLKSALETVDLFTYCTDSVLLSAKSPNKIVKRWYKADAAIRLILTSNMTEEVVAQLGHIDRASDMWSEARRLFAGHTLTDWTLLVTALITTKYADGEDLTAHITKMKSYRRDLILMKHDIADDLFACFFRISMPSTWNYVFAGLPSRYTPNEVERHIKDEYGIRTNQAGGASSYQAAHNRGNHTASKTRDSRSHIPIPSEPYCDNCRISGHWTKDCYAKGGPKFGQGPQRKKKGKKDKESKEDKRGHDRRKSQHKTNQVTAPHSSDRTLSYMSISTPSLSTHSHFGWVLDGGSTTHICTIKSAFITFTPRDDTIKGIHSGGTQLRVLGTGSVKIIVNVKGHDERIITLKDVCYAPDTCNNLISESQMDKKGMTITKVSGHTTISQPDGDIVMEGKLRHGLYVINCAIAPPSSLPSHVTFAATLSTSDLDLWHCRLSHLGESGLKYLIRHQLAMGINAKPSGSLSPCNGCAKGKHPQAPFPHSAMNGTQEILDRLHMDLQGPFDRSITGYTYTLVVVDDHS